MNTPRAAELLLVAAEILARSPPDAQVSGITGAAEALGCRRSTRMRALAARDQAMVEIYGAAGRLRRVWIDLTNGARAHVTREAAGLILGGEL